VVDFGVHGKQNFVAGVDGAWPKVRRLLTPVTPSYSGIYFIMLDMPSVTTEHPSISRSSSGLGNNIENHECGRIRAGRRCQPVRQVDRVVQ